MPVQTQCDKDFCHAGQQANGEGGIRTLGMVAHTPVFETGPIDHSGTSPERFQRILEDADYSSNSESVFALGPGSLADRSRFDVSASRWTHTSEMSASTMI